MAITVEAIYENGVLKPDQPLPLKERERVRVDILNIPAPADVQKSLEAVRRSYGSIPWTGDAETLRKIAMS